MGQFRINAGKALAARPLAWVCLAFSASVGLASFLLVGWQMLLLFALSLFLGLALLLRRHPRAGAAALAVTLGMLLVWLGHYRVTDLERNWAGRQEELTLQVLSRPEETAYGYSLETRVSGESPLSGEIVLLYTDSFITAKPGDELTGEVRLRSARGADPVWSLYRYSEGIALTGSMEEWELREKDTPPSLLPAVWANSLSERLSSLFSPDTAAFLTAVTIGDRSELSDSLARELSLTGLSHMAAASGLHVHMLAGAVGILPGERRKKYLLLIPLLPLYAAIAGFSPSICRAVLMQELVLIAFVLRREADSVTSLSLALALILLGEPLAIANAGLQLSFAAMAGILLLTDRLREALGEWDRLNGLRNSLILSVASGVFTTPLVLYYFGTASLIGILSNLLLLWLLPILLPLALLAGITGWTLLAAPIEAATALMLKGIHLLAGWPFAAFTVSHTPFLLWMAFSGLLALITLVKGWKGCRILSVLALSLATLVLCFSGFRAYYGSEGLRLTMLDVGQGQCLLLTTEDQTAVIDCGSQNEDSWNALDLELRLAGRERIDLLILTHYDSDHVSGLTELLKSRSVELILLPVPTPPEQKELSSLFALSKEQGSELVFVSRSAEETLGERGRLRVMTTRSEEEWGLAVLVGWEEEYLLVTGDADLTGEEHLTEEFPLPEVRLLVAGHHGSKYATGEKLLETVSPEQVLVSVGINSYGHPTEEMLERCRAADAEVSRTDEEGNIYVRLAASQ